MLLKRIDELSSQDPFTNPDRLIDNAASDREASEEEGHERVQAQLRELRAQLEASKAAITRIHTGTYGKCLVGGEPISKERLEILPTATTCIKHQEKTV